MKIPGIQRRGVQGLSQRDIGAPLREAGAAADLAKNMDAIVQEGVVASENVYNTYIEHQIRKADSSFKLGLKDFQGTIGAQQFFDPIDLPEDIDFTRTETVGGEEVPRKQIPAWEVYPQMLQNHISQSITDNESNIPEARFASKWRQSVEVGGAESVASAYIQASDAQQRELQHFSKNSINEYLSKSMWDEAANITSTYPGSEAEIENLSQDTQAKIVTGKQENELEIYYDILSMEEDDTQLYHIDQSLEVLEDEKYNGDIVDQDKRFRIIELLRRTKTDLIRTTRGKVTVAHKELIRDMKQATSANNKGNRVDPSHMDELMQKARVLGLVGDPTYYDTVEGFKESYKIGLMTNEFLQQNPLIQQSKLSRMEEKAKTGLDWLQHDNFRAASKEYQSKLNSDAISAANDIGMIKLKPLDFKDLASSLNNRALDAHLIQDKTSRFTGYLSKDEAAQFSDLISKAPSEQRLDLLGQISEGLGQDAYKFYGQLDLKKAVPVFTLAGKRHSEGDNMAAGLILQGQDVLEKYPSIIKNVGMDMDPNIDIALGSAYWQDLASKSAIKNSIHSVYAALALEDRDFSGDVLRNDDRLNRAIEIVTGGLAVINDVKVETPINTTPEVFQDWVSRINPEFFKLKGTPKNFSAKQVSEGIKEGDIELVQTFNRGKYNLLSSKEQKLLFSDMDVPFVLEYEADALPVGEKGFSITHFLMKSAKYKRGEFPPGYGSGSSIFPPGSNK